MGATTITIYAVLIAAAIGVSVSAFLLVCKHVGIKLHDGVILLLASITSVITFLWALTIRWI